MKHNPIMEKLFQSAAVEWKPLGEVAEYSTMRIHASELDETNYVGVDNLLQNRAGKTWASYMPNTGRLTGFVENDILIGNIRPYLKKIWQADGSGGASGDVLVIHVTDKTVNPRYLYQVLADDKFFAYNMQHAKGAKMPRGNKAAILQYQIPIPPLEAQHEIVRVLDNFTELTEELMAELSAELTARKKQYEYYRNLLLTFENHNAELLTNERTNERTNVTNPFANVDMVWKTLGEVVPPQRGKRLVRNQLDSAGQFPVYQNSLEPLGFFSAKNCREYMTFIIAAGAAGEIGFSDIEFWAADDCYYFDCPKDLLNDKFLYYFLMTQKNQLSGQVRRASVPRLGKQSIEKMKIPIPPLDTQTQIVAILDRFDTLTNSISEGLPREIALRQKQYEYYRERLLSFQVA